LVTEVVILEHAKQSAEAVIPMYVMVELHHDLIDQAELSAIGQFANHRVFGSFHIELEQCDWLSHMVRKQFRPNGTPALERGISHSAHPEVSRRIRVIEEVYGTLYIT
jgi:hypothetical protein